MQLRRNALLHMSQVGLGWAERSHDSSCVLVLFPSSRPAPVGPMLTYAVAAHYQPGCKAEWRTSPLYAPVLCMRQSFRVYCPLYA